MSKAEVAIFDMKGNEVYRYETTDKELNITLPVGDYIVKQTITPPNYEATTIQMKVSVLEEKMVDAVLENVPLVDVPDTGKDMRLFTSFGLGTILLGLLMIACIVYKREQN